ncbi:hypothetical protein ACI2OX_07460 [Bacillus sp. N9]
MKRELWTNDIVTTTDILGFEQEHLKTDIVSQIAPAIDRLATSIYEEILALNNQQAPKAVMLVGGGSMTPELSDRLAMKLDFQQIGSLSAELTPFKA